MSIQMREDYIGIEAPPKAEQTPTFGLYIPDVNDSCGVVKFKGGAIKDSSLKIGDKVYYGKDRQRIRMQGQEIDVMKLCNIIAIEQSKETIDGQR